MELIAGVDADFGEDLAERVRSGRLNPVVGAVRPLTEAPSALAPDHWVPGKTIIRVTQGG